MKTKQYSLGRVVDHDPRSRMFALNTDALVIKSVTHDRFIPILDQGQVGSCTGNAGIGAISTAPFIDKDNKTYSRNESGALKLYSDAETIDGRGPYPPNDYGSSGLSIAKALLSAGLISSYQHTFTLQDALKAVSKYPIIVGISWSQTMYGFESDGHLKTGGIFIGGHEIVGRQIDVENGRIWFDNSWSDSWGLKGRFYLTWEEFANLLAQNGDVIALIPPNVTPPAPVVKSRTLRLVAPYMTGTDVALLQTLLGIPSDGIFGPDTKVAVVNYQRLMHIHADGVCGPVTWASISKKKI